MHRKSPEAIPARMLRPRWGPHSTRRRHEVPAQTKRPRQDSDAQPSEPFLFPKLRNDFADFPQLPYSIDQRLLTLET